MPSVPHWPGNAAAGRLVAAADGLLEPFLMMYRFRRILYATSIAEIRGKYIGTMFGLAWAVLYPFLFLGLYATVYALVLKVHLSNLGPFDYVLLVFSGLVPFIGFSEALGTTVAAVVANKNLLKNTMFPIELLPVRAVITASVSMLVGLCGLLIATWAGGHVFLSQLLIVPILLLQLLFSVGIGWTLAALNVFVRDLSQAIGIIVLFLMIVSPIGYTIDMIPSRLLLVSQLNPLYYLIELYRECLLFGTVSVRLLAVFTVIALTSLVFGHFLFSRLKPIFAEYV